MIEKIELSHFQAHKNTVLELGNVTILRGPSDSGKSSVIRALNAFFNCNIKPENAFKGEFPVKVTLFANGEAVSITRNSKGTTYSLGDTEFSKVNKKCPDEIKDFLGIREYSIDTDEKIFIQIQSQFDKPFLLSETPSTIAKIIGRLSNLNVVLCASRDLYADSLSEKQTIKLLNEQKKEAETELLSYRNLGTYKALLDKANAKSEEIEQQKKLLAEYDSLLSLAESIEPKLAVQKELISKVDAVLYSMLPDVISLTEKVAEYSLIEASSSILTKTISDSNIGTLPDDISSVLDMLQHMTEIDYALKLATEYAERKAKLRIVDVSPAYKLVDSVLALISSIDALSSAIDSAEAFNSSIKAFKEKLIKLESSNTEYKRLLSESLPGTCKTCSLLGL